MSIPKKIFLSLLTVLCLAVVWQWELVSYGIGQGRGQLRIVMNTVPVDDLLADPAFPDSLKQQLLLIGQARQFAVEELGLKDTENYTTYYDQQGKVLLWNVSACQPFAFEPKTWWFPIVGTVPYKGFFKKEKAQAEVDRLKAEGWEVRARPVAGWSTLGWFKDPILSSMLERSEGALAELIIHELTHTTLFVPNDVVYNENLASFIGEKGAERFLKRHFGDSTAQLTDYLNARNDGDKFVQHMLAGTRRLDSLYKSFAPDLPDEEKASRKQSVIQEIVNSLDTVSFVNDRYRRIFDSALPDNAYFMSYMRYHSYGDSLQAELDNRFDGDLRAFLQHAVEQYGK